MGLPVPSMPSNRARYPEKLRPPERVKAQWRRRGKLTGERGYAQRWAKFWERTVVTLRARESWKDDDVALIAEYVRRCRLVELHVEEAETDPYPVNPDSGFVRPHPGWERSLAESREARAVATELKLTPRARHAAGIDIPNPDQPPRGNTPYGQTAAWVDDQVGPDGRAL